MSGTTSRSLIGATLRKPSYAALAVALTVIIAVAFYFLSLRSAGANTTIFTTSLTTPGFWLGKFGVGYLLATVSLDVIIAALMSLTIVLTLAIRSVARAGGACSTASIVLGVTTASCPTCVVPLAGTFGLVFFGASLPLLGLEFQALAAVVLLAGLIWILRRAGRASSGLS